MITDLTNKACLSAITVTNISRSFTYKMAAKIQLAYTHTRTHARTHAHTHTHTVAVASAGPYASLHLAPDR